MKTSVFFAAFSIMALSAFLIFARFDVFNHNISVTVSEDSDTYTFVAQYNTERTLAVESYINSYMRPNSLGTSEADYVDVNTSLTDGTRFYIKESPGKLKINFDKRKSSTASYLRIKRMCEGVKQLLAGK